MYYKDIYSNGLCRPPLQTGNYDTKPFLRWVRALGRSEDTPSIPKSASGLVGIPLKKGSPSAR